MKKFLKTILWKITPLVKLFLRLFFDKKYLTGRYFDKSFEGYIFALRSIWVKNILRLSKPKCFPTALTCQVSNDQNIYFHPDDINNFQSPGTYFQNFKGKIYIGKGTYIAPNVGIITANHKLTDLDAHTEGLDVKLGEKCWIGMNSVILPGVELGDNTIVAAGAVVTKSFTKGYVVIGGVPAKEIKEIQK
ncbi:MULTISPECIES: acyltransferase [Acinetobacter]|uniref:acyltransferase n=1 Tax=Acinetobacter TaxID=469 RepID=UPI002D20F084|nr:acyltransferase [Acinetobacter sp. IK31]MEB3862543.1 acyltransferase [Acinetobacter sp. IK31]